MKNANKSSKILYFAMVREVEKWPDINIRYQININFRLVGPVTTPNFSEIG